MKVKAILLPVFAAFAMLFAGCGSSIDVKATAKQLVPKILANAPFNMGSPRCLDIKGVEKTGKNTWKAKAVIEGDDPVTGHVKGFVDIKIEQVDDQAIVQLDGTTFVPLVD